jgi:hypothetical protein
VFRQIQVLRNLRSLFAHLSAFPGSPKTGASISEIFHRVPRLGSKPRVFEGRSLWSPRMTMIVRLNVPILACCTVSVALSVLLGACSSPESVADATGEAAVQQQQPQPALPSVPVPVPVATTPSSSPTGNPTDAATPIELSLPYDAGNAEAATMSPDSGATLPYIGRSMVGIVACRGSAFRRVSDPRNGSYAVRASFDVTRSCNGFRQNGPNVQFVAPNADCTPVTYSNFTITTPSSAQRMPSRGDSTPQLAAL